MALTPADSAGIPETIDAVAPNWETAFEANGSTVIKAKAVEVECESTSPIAVECRINGGGPFRVDKGQTKYREFIGGVNKIEFRGATGLVLWDARAGQPAK